MYPEDDGYEVSVRDRVYGQATSSSEGRRSIAVVILSVCIFLFVISLSCRQATAPGPARNVLESGIVSLTDLDQMLADEGDSLREFAANTEDAQFLIPGYPLDVVLSKEEVAGASNEELRALILERSSALVYAEGIDSFDRTGDQSLRRFSIQGVLVLGVSQVSNSTHDRANFFAMLSLLGCALSAALVAAGGAGWARMRLIGMATAVGAIPVVLMFFLLRLLVGAIGGDDPFISAYRDITRATLGIPLRNGLIVLAAGAAVVAAALLLERLERLVSPRPVAVVDDDF